MIHLCRSYKYGGLLLAVLSFVVVVATLGAFAVNAESSKSPATQNQSPTPTPTPTPAASPTPTPVNWSSDPMLKRFVFRSIGPASMGGRIDDIATVEQNPYVIYVAFATNGLWKSTNNGTTFQPVFENYGTHSIGDVAVAPSDQNIVWVGTG